MACATQTNLEDIVLSERSQTQDDRDQMVSFTFGIGESRTPRRRGQEGSYRGCGGRNGETLVKVDKALVFR